MSPCVFSTWLTAGSVRTEPLAAILSGPTMTRYNQAIRAEAGRGGNGDDDDRCDPGCDPNAECTPGYPSHECDPQN